MKFSKIYSFSILILGVIATLKNLDGSIDNSVKSTNKLNIQALKDEDNHPTPDHLKKPLVPYKSSSQGNEQQSEEEPASSYNSFIMSLSMIMVTELFDKTFLISALFSMKHSRWVVFSAAWISLVIMTILSGIVGHALPTLISQRLTQFLASALFLVFGYKLLREGLEMSKDSGVEDELAEVEEEIASSKLNNQLNNIEGGQSHNNTNNISKKWYDDYLQQVSNLASFIFTPIWIQVFVMTFLGEWGDRSQIATIAMAAGSEYWFVILGAIIGHGLCTATACLGGKLLAKKVSIRNITLGGSVAFFIFAILYFYDAYYNIES